MKHKVTMFFILDICARDLYSVSHKVRNPKLNVIFIAHNLLDYNYVLIIIT